MDSGGDLLNRVKAFLPMIEKANLELNEKIAKEGSESVLIDKGLVDEPEPKVKEVEKERGTMKNQKSNEISNKQMSAEKQAMSTVTQAEGEAGKEEEGAGDTQVQIEFALGNFEDTPLAIAEELAKKQAGEAGNEEGEES
jgi:hypothetical protein